MFSQCKQIHVQVYNVYIYAIHSISICIYYIVFVCCCLLFANTKFWLVDTIKLIDMLMPYGIISIHFYKNDRPRKNIRKIMYGNVRIFSCKKKHCKNTKLFKKCDSLYSFHMYNEKKRKRMCGVVEIVQTFSQR